MSETINILRAQFDAQMKQMQDDFRDGFNTAMKEVFDTYPEIDGFSWTQYAPYFNDGDECVFGVHADPDWSLKIKWNTEDAAKHEDGPTFVSGEYYDWPDELTEKKTVEYKHRPGETYNKTTLVEPYHTIYNEVSKLIYAVPEDFMKSLFGNHVRVTVNRDGTVDVSDYDHD